MEHLEGRQSILAALRARQRKFQVILISHGAHAEKTHEVIALAEQLGVPVRRVDWAELDGLAHGTTHGGVLAIASAKPRTTPLELLEIIDARLAAGKSPLLLLLEGIDDARNLGFTLRSAEALGTDAVLIKKHLWDFDPVEIARPASGAYERLPLVQVESTDVLKDLQKQGLRLYGCIAGARRTIYQIDLAAPAILAIGGEKRGLSGAVRALCDQFITIPLGLQTSDAAADASNEATSDNSMMSLSLSHAAAIVLAEAMRQRSVNFDENRLNKA